MFWFLGIGLSGALSLFFSVYGFGDFTTVHDGGVAVAAVDVLVGGHAGSSSQFM